MGCGAWACNSAQAPGEEPVPEDLGRAEGPPGCQLLALQQHTDVRTHEEEVLAALPRNVHQIVDGSRARGGGS